MQSLKLVGPVNGRSGDPGRGVRVGSHVIGGGSPTVIAGPCAVESPEQLMEVAAALKKTGAHILRAGAFKPRSSPYSFQGMGAEGIAILRRVKDETGLPIITEVLNVSDLDLISRHADMLQIGARNMQNFELLKAAGRQPKPVLLKRGISATIEEWLLAAEYIALEGNNQVVLCERGIRTYESYTRNTLDLSAVPAIKGLSRLPIIVDPSHGTGRAEMVLPMAKAALAAGADGIMVEVHPDPSSALSDGSQSLDIGGFYALMADISPVRSKPRLRVSPSLGEFGDLVGSHGVVPLCAEFMADMETSASTYLKLGSPEESFILESVQGGDRLGRYSFVGLEPLAVFSSKGSRCRIDDREGLFGAKGLTSREGSPIGILRELWSAARPANPPGLPRFFGGAVGYLGYDLVRHVETLPDIAPDVLDTPDSYLIFPKILLIFDHVSNRIRLVCNCPTSGKSPEEIYRSACESLKNVVSKLLLPLPYSSLGPESAENAGDGGSHGEPPDPGLKSNLPRAEFEDAVRKAKEYIARGDIFQVVLSQRFSAPINKDPFSLYRMLRAINPSPYMFYVNTPDMKLVGSSPEILVRLEEDRAELRPIAGTRPRGATLTEDSAFAADLLADPKERAEHIMLVDLGRNDLGRVCAYGSVHVRDLMSVERYSHVMHIASGISGTLAPDKDQFHLLEAAFPAGTVSGAPKVRAMEIIEELEPSRRGPYAGVVGYFGWNGNMDTCITIRTLVIKDGTAHIQAGAGIVADSDPSKEYEETVSKARAMFSALGIEGRPSR